MQSGKKFMFAVSSKKLCVEIKLSSKGKVADNFRATLFCQGRVKTKPQALLNLSTPELKARGKSGRANSQYCSLCRAAKKPKRSKAIKAEMTKVLRSYEPKKD